MMQRKHFILVPGLLAAATIVAVACRDFATPARSVAPRPDFWEVFAACFRMTGGGRIDKPGANMGGAEYPTGKNTPVSRDFATFGFQARPTACSSTSGSGSGHITWVEHSTATSVYGGFVLHGDVDKFVEVKSEYSGKPCGRFSGPARAKRRDTGETLQLFFEVHHACDEGEPGVGHDHIRMLVCLTECPPEGGTSVVVYDRAGILTGGNLQYHRLTGSGS